VKGAFTLLVLGGLFSAALAQWEPDLRLTNDNAISYTSCNNCWSIAASGDTVHVVWYDARDGGYDSLQAYYKRSCDGGLTWGPDQRLSARHGRVLGTAIALSGSTVHVVWVENRLDDAEVYYRRSTDAGATWLPETCVTESAWVCGDISLAASDAFVHLVWWAHGEGWDASYYRRSTDAGATWGPRITLPNLYAFTCDPTIAVAGSKVHVVWPDAGGAQPAGMYYRCSNDRGASWGAPTRIVADSGFCEGASIAARDSFVHMVWRDDSGYPYRLYYKRSSNGGSSWEPDRVLIDDTSHARGPSIAVSGTRVHVVWQSDRTGTNHLYYCYSSDDGLTWSPDTCLSASASVAFRPSIAVSGPTLHLVWYDERDGNDEIYYKRNPSGNAGIGEESTPRVRELLATCCLPPAATIVRGVLFLSGASSPAPQAPSRLLDISGRKVLALHPGPNDVSRLSPGVYFVREAQAQAQAQAVCKVIVTR
jgi:hypothetical protein